MGGLLGGSKPSAPAAAPTPPPPPPPPPPGEVADSVKGVNKDRVAAEKAATKSSLIISRDAVDVGSDGSGLNI